MEAIFIQLAIILFTAFILSYIVRALRQPIVIGYILAGVVIAFIISFGFADLGASTEIIDIFSKLGIAFLLFIVGLHLNPKIIKEIGISSLIIGITQMILTFAITFAISSYFLNYDLLNSAFIGIALSFSSTIIVMKLLSDKRQLDFLYGKISIGILIIQDLVAIAVLMFISSFAGGVSLGSFASRNMLAGGILIVVLFLAGFFVMPRVTRNIARSQELLFLFSICWCFLIAALFSFLGFSIEIGALIAGIVLSISPYSAEISAKIRPLRDFFLIIFFIILGLKIPIANIDSIIVHALILSAIALIFKPIILIVLSALFGYTKRTNFLVGTTLAQISEFSIIVLMLGVSVSATSSIINISENLVYTLALTLLITIILSTYMTIYSRGLYNKLSYFSFERKNPKREKKIKRKYDAILFGYNRMGFSILKALKKIKKRYLIVDFNPDIISDLGKWRTPCLYGDAYDVDLLDELPLDKLQLAISTIPDLDTNIIIMENVRMVNPDAIIILRAHQIDDALELYKKGANYVLTPHFLGGDYLAKMIKHLKSNNRGYKSEKTKHIKMLKDRIKKGHEHPDVNK